MKELYLIDRKSIEETDFSITGDEYYSLNHGPVLSATKNLLEDLGRDSNNYWDNFLTKQDNKYFPDIILIKDTGQDYLSDKDKEYINLIDKEFKEYDEWKIREYTHNLPEWKNPEGSSKKIRYVDIMIALGKTEAEIKEAKKEYDLLNDLSNLANSND
ncbi:MAG: SocA family protein [Rickettsiales bacterium]|nr:SocA family protein [Rickettsiales bacterium]